MKMMKHVSLTVGLAASLSAAQAIAADSAGETARKAGEGALTNVYDAIDKNTVKLDFEKGSAKLSDTEVASLRSLVKAANEDGKIEKIYVGVWSDKAFSDAKKANYTDTDKDLAKERANNIEKVLEDVGSRKVEVVNMAEKPNWLEEKLGFEEAKIKGTVAGKEPGKEMSDRDREDREMAAIGRTFKNEGGASKAVVVVQHAVAH